MGHVFTTIKLRNPRREDVRELEVRALVDTGANHLCLPATVVAELSLEAETTRTVKTADGGVWHCRYVGPIKVRFQNRECFVGALEFGDQVLLGAIPLEDMDFVIDPSRQVLAVNPEHPDTAHSLAVGVRLA